MKFKMKALALALVLSAAAGSASAAIDTAGSGNSSVMLFAFDKVTLAGAAFDLGKNYSDFSIIGTSFADSNVDDQGKWFRWDLNATNYGTSFASLLNQAATTSNIVWGILAVDNNGTGAGGKGLISTMAPTATTVTALTTTQMANSGGSFDNYVSSFNATTAGQTHTTEANGASYATAGNMDPYNSIYKSVAGKVNLTGTNTLGGLDQDLRVFQTTLGTSSVNTNGTQSAIFGNGAKITLTSAGVLTYTTVPEADSWAMMLLGLGFMGFVARRKQA